MENEIWKDIPGYEGRYQASNLGNIISLKFRGHSKIHLMGKYFDKDGYVKVTLYKNNIRINIGNHRLVAQAFIENPLNKPQVNHKNGIKDDNKVENLEWVTRSENEIHKYKVLGYKQKNNHFQKNHPKQWKGKFGQEHNCSIKVNQYDLFGNFIKTWDCISDVKIQLGIDTSAISKCCKGKLKKTGGFIWKYY